MAPIPPLPDIWSGSATYDVTNVPTRLSSRGSPPPPRPRPAKPAQALRQPPHPHPSPTPLTPHPAPQTSAAPAATARGLARAAVPAANAARARVARRAAPLVGPAARLLAPGPAPGAPRPRSLAARAAVAEGETFTYQAEVDRLMDLIVNSLYSNRDIFLRELISNASDALDKARFKGLKDSAYLADGADLRVRVRGDAEAKTVVIEDNGVGMTKQEIVDSLGTIARSGTKKFMEMLKEAKATEGNNLIGQFGVGFYSSFLVADRVTVETKSADDESTWAWESAAGSHQYSITKVEGSDLKRGTRITLHLKEDCLKYADNKELKGLVSRYSEFISFPIDMWGEVPKQVEVVDDFATKKKQEEEDKKAKEEGREAAKVDAVMKTQTEYDEGYTRANDSKPLWTLPPRDVEDADYKEFFKATFKEFVDPLAWNHFSVEGTYEFKGLLYVPGMAPFDQFGMGENTKSMRLYVKKVFISDSFDEELIPRWLGFIKGVIDSSDLPLNVSREILQESRMTRAIKKQVVKRAITMLSGLADKPDDFKTMWDSFGRNIKLGCVEDQENQKALSKLLRFASSKTDGAKDELASLDEYVSRAKEGQDSIFFMAADSRQAAEAAPFVERLTKLGYEVLYLTEPIDEYVVTSLSEYDGKKFTDVTKEGIELPEDKANAEDTKKAAEALKGLTDYMKERLGDKVESVTVSSRLEETPCVLVTSKQGWSANMERIMKAQAMGDNRAMEFMKGQKILEINPDSQVIKSINSLVGSGDKATAGDLTDLMFETALFTSGFSVDDKRGYAAKVFSMMDKMAAGSGAGEAPAVPEAGASTTVEPEVVADSEGKKDDPWA